MKQFKGTPGPWFKNDQAIWNTVDGIKTHERVYVAEVMSMRESSEKQQANAHLIAAAPELLEALQYINHVISHGTQMDIVKGQEMAQSAINKALGGE